MFRIKNETPGTIPTHAAYDTRTITVGEINPTTRSGILKIWKQPILALNK